jgi:predicted nucleotidyltransferase
MGSPTKAASRATLFNQTRSALLSVLYGRSEESFYLRQLSRITGAGNGAIQRELKQLTSLGLLNRRMQGNQVLYCANLQSPIFGEIKGLIAKTVGLHDTIRFALSAVGSKVKIAFIFGSVARNEEKINSDVDLMVLGDAPFSEVVTALGPAQKAVGREINPAVFSIAEFRSKLGAGNHFLKRLMGEKKIFVIGTQNEFTKLAAK